MNTQTAEKTIIFLSIAVYSMSRIFPHQLTWALVPAALLLAAAAVGRRWGALHPALFCVLLMALPLATPLLDSWPGHLLAPLAAYYAVVLPVAALRKSRTPLGWGGIPRNVRGLMAATILGSALALVAWTLLTEPDLTPFLGQLRTLSPSLLPVTGIGFALVNALLEEVAFRGILLGAATRVFRSPAAAVILQAISFGLLHYVGGFPNGTSGTIMTVLYGLLLGAIRVRSRGMVAPVVTHFFADLTIFMILVAVMLS